VPKFKTLNFEVTKENYEDSRKNEGKKELLSLQFIDVEYIYDFV